MSDQSFSRADTIIEKTGIHAPARTAEAPAFAQGPLHDLHVHLDFMAHGEEVAYDACKTGTLLFSNTVTPAGYVAARRRFAQCENVRIGLGLHPWWIDARPEQRSFGNQRGNDDRLTGQNSQESAVPDATGFKPNPTGAASAGSGAGGAAGAAGSRPSAGPGAGGEDADRGPFDWRSFDWESAIKSTRFIGEIGLDFGKRHSDTRIAQQAAFEHIAAICANQGEKLISLHSVKAAREVLDVLSLTGATETCECVFHWFSGPSDQLKRAIGMNCLFSVGPRMLATGKGREYVKALPANRILLETDAPPAPGSQFTFGELRALLETAARQIAAIKGPDTLEIIAETSARILKA